MMRILLLVGCAFLGTVLGGQDTSRLPDWAATAVRNAANAPVPPDADAWVLLERTEIAYVGDGEIRTRRSRVVRILSDRGIREGGFSLRGLGGKTSKVKKLKGWNLRPNGELVKLDSDRVTTFNDAGDEEFSTNTLTSASLDRVIKGSIVAFESIQDVKSPIGPVASAAVLEEFPVRNWELEVAKEGGWFNDLQSVALRIDRIHFSPWIPGVTDSPSGGLRAVDLPPLPKDEGARPGLASVLPQVRVRFLDPKLATGSVWGSWDGVARWATGLYSRGMVGPATLPPEPRGMDGLAGIWSWMAKSLTYKQVYLSPERGWIPDLPSEVARKRYGDCKDLAGFLLSEARNRGFLGVPVLVRIGPNRADPTEQPFPIFNHVIVAVKLESSLGLLSEVRTPSGLYLLLDPTAATSELGYMDSSYRGRQVMLCHETGAEWVQVPDRSIQEETIEIKLEGEIKGQELTANLRIREGGGAWGLRRTAFRSGAEGLRERLLKSQFDLPAAGTLEVLKFSDPLDLTHLFELEIKVIHPQGFRNIGDEWELSGLGIPQPFSLIQKVGTPRRFPVSMPREDQVRYSANIKVPLKVLPVLAKKSEDSRLRAYQWKAQCDTEGSGSLLKLEFEHRYKPSTFGFEVREQGVQEFKRDRNSYKTFREEALAFKAGGH